MQVDDDIVEMAVAKDEQRDDRAHASFTRRDVNGQFMISLLCFLESHVTEPTIAKHIFVSAPCFEIGSSRPWTELQKQDSLSSEIVDSSREALRHGELMNM